MDPEKNQAAGKADIDDLEMQEMQVLLSSALDTQRGGNAKAGPKNPDNLLTRLDERVNVKVLCRQWGPYLEFVVKLMLVSPFIDDSLRTMTNFTQLTKQVGEQGFLGYLAAPESTPLNMMAGTALLIGLASQLLGSFCLLKDFWTDGATKALIAWAILQPALYGQLSNYEFVAESISITGGLFMLRAHLIFEQTDSSVGARTKLVGRLLIPAMYVYEAGQYLWSALVFDETSDLAMYVTSMSAFLANTFGFVGLVVMTALVAAGLKSRIVALVLAMVNLGCVFFQHPFFFFVSREGGEWKYNEDMPFPNVALPEDLSPVDFTLGEIFDLHRYYFFIGLSTSGALLLLAQYGPGEISMQKDETILPIRAQD